MLVVRIVSILLALGLVYTIVTQVILPTWHGTPMFPWFRGRFRKAERDLKEVRERKSVATTTYRIAQEESEAVKLESKARRVVDDAIDELIEEKKDAQKR